MNISNEFVTIRIVNGQFRLFMPDGQEIKGVGNIEIVQKTDDFVFAKVNLVVNLDEHK